ncbi:chromate transporter [Oscillospiraceae bacterium PP1C4]
MINLLLFTTFFKIGLFSIGGGYAMIPMIQQHILGHGWMAQSDLIDFIAISESTPGPFSVNIATFVGMSQGGLFGALCATMGLVLPSFLIILLIARYFLRFQDNPYVKSVLSVLRPTVVGLIGSAAFAIFLSVVMGGMKARELLHLSALPPISWRAILITAIVFAISLWKKKLHPIWLLVISGALGFAFHLLLPMIS